MYKCLVIDDDILQRDAVALYISKLPQLETVATCANGVEALQVLTSEPIDIVFSDIEMPELSGLNLLRTLKKAPVFVFISSHSEYAVESYNLDVIDFIVKPVTLERLLKAANKAIEYIELKKHAPVSQSATLAEKDNYFYIRESNDLIRIMYDDVGYIESMGNFSRIYTTKDARHITLVNLKNLEAQLPAASFTRIHKQYIINHHLITAISSDEIRIADKFTLPLSPAYRQELLNKTVNNNIVTRNMK